MSCFCNNGTGGFIDPNLVEGDLRAKISYIALVQTKELSHRVPHCPNDRHFGIRVVVRETPGGVRNKHVFLHWSCQDNKSFRIEDVTGTQQIELYEAKPGYGKQVTRDMTVFQLRDTVTAAGRWNDCLSVAEAMYRAATGAVETIAVAPESDDDVKLSDVDITTLAEEMNTKTQDEAERLLEGRAKFDSVM